MGWAFGVRVSRVNQDRSGGVGGWHFVVQAFSVSVGFTVSWMVR